MNSDYYIQIDGKPMLIECSKPSDKQQLMRWLAIYKHFLQSECNKENDENRGKMIDQIAESLSEDSITKMLERLKTDEGQKEITNAVRDILEAYDSDDIEPLSVEEINGNTFSYKQGVDIDKIREKLSDIGNETRGNNWRVEIDKDGEVVLFE